MKFGLFDHVESCHMTLADQFDKRLDYVAAADALGYYAYNVAEHHATPLNMVPVPGVYLGAVARATKKMRLGPLVYLLPLYSPLRLIEEICILDHLSHGRLDIGVGRGVSPFELNYHHVKAEESREIMRDALDAITYGLTHDALDHEGPYFNYTNVPMELKPLQQPLPPICCPSSNAEGAAWAGEQGLHYAGLGSMEMATNCVNAYKEALAKRGAPVVPNDAFPGGAAISVNRHIVIAETDEEALKIAKPVYEYYHANLTKLFRVHGVEGPAFTRLTAGDVEGAMESGAAVVGSPETVAEILEEQIKVLGINYLIVAPYFGNITHEHAMQTLTLFAERVMPKLADL